MTDKNELTFREAIELFRQVYHRFEKIEGRSSGVEGAMIELVKQVGELAKHVMVAEHYYFAGRETKPEYATNREIIGDELADVFSMLIRIADYYDIDLVEAYVQARQMERESLTHMGAWAGVQLIDTVRDASANNLRRGLCSNHFSPSRKT